MHSGHSCGAKSTVARDTGLITPGKINIYNAIYCDTNRYVHTKYTACNAVVFLYIQDLN